MNFWVIIEGCFLEMFVLYSYFDMDFICKFEVWEFDLFSGEIDGLWIYGCGVFDMKLVFSV